MIHPVGLLKTGGPVIEAAPFQWTSRAGTLFLFPTWNGVEFTLQNIMLFNPLTPNDL
jgi:hypothetical protein